MMRKRTHRWIFVLLIFALLFLSACAPRLPEGENPWRDAVTAYFEFPEQLRALRTHLEQQEYYREDIGARDVIREYTPLGTLQEEFHTENPYLTYFTDEDRILTLKKMEGIPFFRVYGEYTPLAISDKFYTVRGVELYNGVKAFEYRLCLDRREPSSKQEKRLEIYPDYTIYSAKELHLEDFQDIELGDSIEKVAEIDPVTMQYFEFWGKHRMSPEGYFYSIHLLEECYFTIWYYQPDENSQPLVARLPSEDWQGKYLPSPYAMANEPFNGLRIDDRDKIYK